MFKYVHSIWSTPSEKNNFDNKLDIKFLNKNFYSYLLSTLLIKKLGYKIELYCDTNSYNTYSLIPYDKINVIDFDSDGFDSKFWIWGKIKTHLLMNEPYVHIDGDVLLFRDIIGNKIENSNYSVVVQSLENENIIGHYFINSYLNSINPYQKFEKKHDINWNKYNLHAYNCGVVGFSNMNLKNLYANKVKEILFDLSNDDEFQYNRKKYDGMFLIAEQSLLYYLLRENNVIPLEIIPEKKIIERNYDWMPIANEIGYCHLWSYSKYKDSVINMIKHKIEKFFPEYKSIIKTFENKIL